MEQWCVLAGLLTACAVWGALQGVPREPVSPNHGSLSEGSADDDDGMPSITLVLGLIAVAVRQGASIPVALDAVGRAVSGTLGERMSQVSGALHRGMSWHDAWAAPCEDAACGRCLRLLRDTLDDAWHRGASPVERLEMAIEAVDRDERAAIEQGASRLSVRLLMPTGLCFLPSFIAIGVVPSIVSFL